MIITGRTLEELERNARSAIAFHVRGTPQAGEPVEVELVPHEDYAGDILTVDGQRVPARSASSSVPSANVPADRR